MRSIHALSWLGMPKLYIGAPMTRMSAPRNSSSTSLPPSSAIPTAPAGAFAGRTVGRRLLSRCGIGLASRSRRTTSRPGIAAFSAATNAAESWREAEFAPVMLESMWRRFIVFVPDHADAQVRALPSKKCQRSRLDAGLDSFRRIENAFCRVFGLKEVDRHVEHHHVRCGDASRRPRFEKRARCCISLGWAVRELVHELTARFIQIGFRHHKRSNAQIARDDAAERLTQ